MNTTPYAELSYTSPSSLQEFEFQSVHADAYWYDMHPDGRLLLDIESFVTWCLKSTSPAFRQSKALHHQTHYLPCSSTIAHCLEALRAGENRLLFHSACHFSAKVDLCLTMCKKLSIAEHGYPEPNEHLPDGSLAAALYNRLVDEIRKAGKTVAFKKKGYREAARLTRNETSLRRYVDALFQVRSRLILIRLDLKYRKAFKADISFEKARADLDHLLANMRSKSSLFGDLEGYIWRLECGQEGGHHFHVILFFNNDHFQNDSYRGELIKRYWEDVITSGRGECFNCNRSNHKQRFSSDRLAIGRVEASNTNKRASVDRMLHYLCKSEQQIQVMPSKRARTMGRGEMPQVKTVAKLGRPRANCAPLSSVASVLV